MPRYRLLKSIEGQEIPVHRLFLDAQRNDGVEAVDGDFLNFTTASASGVIASESLAEISCPSMGFRVYRGAGTPDLAPISTLEEIIEGQEIPVHRLFLDAQRNDGVEAVDGDFLNFTTAKVRVTATPVDTGGTAVAKGDRAPSAWSEEVVVPNLYVVPCDKSQKDFEESFLQVKMTPYGEPRTSLKIQPNSKWLAGVDGHIADCGPSAPVTSDEAKDAGLAGFEARGLDEVAALRRKWRVPTNSWGSRW